MTREIAGDCKWPPGAQEGGVSSVQNHWKILSVLEYFLIMLIEFQYNKYTTKYTDSRDSGDRGRLQMASGSPGGGCVQCAKSLENFVCS